jgi:D-alanyl-D-alanine carboxypeptidase (penicillin-binding protein 5/6)
MSLVFVLLCAVLRAEAPAVQLVTAKAAVLMDSRTGLILWQQNPDQPLPMASTTKIMTAMVILDHGADRLNEDVVVPPEAIVGGSSRFAAGDRVKLYDLLQGALINSSNEATIAAADYLAGNTATFVGWMNAKAAELGLRKTHFMNTHGLYQPNHYTTARELSLITREALTNPNYQLLRTIIAIKYVSVKAPPRPDVYLENHNKMIGKPVPGVPGAVVDGVKTGYVKEAGKCLAASATRDGWQLIAVVLNSSDTYADVGNLLHYGFVRYEWHTYATASSPCAEVPVRWGARRTVPVGTRQGIYLGAPTLRLEYGGADDLYTVTFAGTPPRAPVARNAELGRLELRCNGQLLVSTPAVALRANPVTPWITITLGVLYWLVVLVILALIGRFYGTRTKAARRRRRLLKAPGRETHPRRTRDG